MNFTPSDSVAREISSLESPVLQARTRDLPLRLSENQKLTVKVVAVAGNQVVLDLGGRPITARTTLPLMPGSTLAVEVRQLRSDVITLSLLAARGPSGPIPIESSLGEILALFGLRDTPVGREIVKGMIEAGLPLDEEGIRESITAVEELGEDASAVKGALFLKQHDLPMSVEVLRRVSAFLTIQTEGSPSPLPPLAEAVAAFLADLPVPVSSPPLGEAPPATAVTGQAPSVPLDAAPPDVAGDIERLNAILVQIRSLPNLPPKTAEALLVPLIQNAATGIEAKLSAVVRAEVLLFSLLETLASNTALPPAVQEGIRSFQMELASLLKPGTPTPNLVEAARERIRTIFPPRAPGGDQAPDTALPLPAAGQKVIAQVETLAVLRHELADVARDLRPLLARIDQELAAHPHPSPAAAPLAQAVRRAVLFAEGEQLVNLGLARNPEQPQMVISLPLAQLPGTPAGELRIYYRQGKEGKPIDPADVTLGFLLHTRSLGALAMNLTVKENHLHGSVTAERGEIKEFLNEHIHLLRERLEALAYDVGDLSVEVGSPTPPPLTTKTVSLDEVATIDVRV